MLRTQRHRYGEERTRRRIEVSGLMTLAVMSVVWGYGFYLTLVTPESGVLMQAAYFMAMLGLYASDTYELGYATYIGEVAVHPRDKTVLTLGFLIASASAGSLTALLIAPSALLGGLGMAAVFLLQLMRTLHRI